VRVETLALRRSYTRQMIWPLLMGLALLLAQTLAVAAQSRPDTFADLAEKVSPSVVNITTSTTVATSAEPAPVVPDGSPFEDFFRDFLDRNGPNGQSPRRSQALGSGFVISEDGFIVTNNHVIEGADEILIEFFEGFELEATLIGTDRNTDLALLKVESDEPLDFVNFGDSEEARVGDWVMAMGNPLGQGFSVSAGIVSARGRALSGSYDDYLQTDAAINRGNSGGPLFNMNGEVIGVNTAILSPNGGSIGIGFAMSSRVAANVIQQLKDFGETRRGWLGVRIQDVTDDLAEGLGLEEARGALVTDVPEGPALEAGLEAGDVILSFDGVNVDDTRGLVRQVGDTEVGKEVRVLVFRDGGTETLRVTLGRREDEERSVPASINREEEPETSEMMSGIVISNLTDELREQLALPEGSEGLIVIDVAEDSEAYEEGLRAGDLITEAGQEKVTNVTELEERIVAAKEAGRKSILLLVRRGGRQLGAPDACDIGDHAVNQRFEWRKVVVRADVLFVHIQRAVDFHLHCMTVQRRAAVVLCHKGACKRCIPCDPQPGRGHGRFDLVDHIRTGGGAEPVAQHDFGAGSARVADGFNRFMRHRMAINQDRLAVKRHAVIHKRRQRLVPGGPEFLDSRVGFFAADLAAIDRPPVGDHAWHNAKARGDARIVRDTFHAFDQGRVQFVGRPVHVDPGAGRNCRQKRRAMRTKLHGYSRPE